ncbi:hypothetical protein HG536_0A06000 [Torulaspora globosa]|uniref:Palmitoyltransferase n=1 Tax=Torulaspora globosa TaxID=48254 RepID=A0A7G3ZB99_9SACH|nr:uncharacterized protein HG536_0A06000 [Torulaspora globosa]QLL30785.1 hypothetical protein HG536_0A06000 [Torulaspora globosa]
MGFYVPRWQPPSWVKYSAPFMLLALITYCTWGFAHRLCYDQLFKKLGRQSVAIGLICVVTFLDALLVVLWCQIKIIGPGRLPKVPPYMILPEDSVDYRSSETTTMIPSLIPPLCYQSGPNGQPIWCNDCASVKTDRAHHSTDLNYCVPRFDHRCVLLCAVIGKDNYRLFLQFVMYMALLAVIVVVSICVFLRQIRKDLDDNLIAILAITIWGYVMSAAMLSTHILCIMKNRTTVEVMARRKAHSKLSYCCYYNVKDGCRYVVQLERDESSDLWRKRPLWRNFSDFLGPNVLFWFIPIGFPNSKHRELEANNDGYPTLPTILGRYYESYGDEGKEMIEKKIAENQYVTKFYAYGDRYHLIN